MWFLVDLLGFFFNFFLICWRSLKTNLKQINFFSPINFFLWHWNYFFFSIEVSSNSWDPSRVSAARGDRKCILTYNLEITKYRRSIFIFCVLEVIDYSPAVIFWCWSYFGLGSMIFKLSILLWMGKEAKLVEHEDKEDQPSWYSAEDISAGSWALENPQIPHCFIKTGIFIRILPAKEALGIS